MKTRIISFLLAITMLLSLITVVSAAQGFTLKVDKTELAAGETVTVTVELGEKMTSVASAAAIVHYNSDVFTYKSATCASGVTVSSRITGTGADTEVTANYFDMLASGTLEAGMYVEMTFTAKEDITADTNAAFAVSATVPVVGSAEDKSFPTDKSAETIVTVTPAPVYKGYTVDASAANGTIAVSETAQVTLKVGNTDSTVTAYNAYDMTVTYNADVLEYTSAEKVNGETPNVVTGDGTLRITGYGADKANGTDNIVLNFTGKTTGEAKVTVTSAKVDAKGNAIENDAPEAKLLTAEATITVGSYMVNKPEYVLGDDTTTGKEDYKFTLKDTGNYDYSDITVKAGDTDITDKLVENDDGSYTIPADQITGTITITAKQTGKTRTVTVAGTGAEDVTAADKATYGTPYTFTVDEKEGYTYTVSAKVGDTTLTLTDDGNGSYTIAGTDLTGDVVITVTKDAAQADTITIVETGDAWADVTRSDWSEGGGVIDESKVDKTFNLKIKLADGKTVDDYVVTINGTAAKLTKTGAGNNIRYMATFKPSAVAVDGKITIDVSYKKATITVNAAEYVKLNDQSIFLITATCEGLADGKTLTYDGTNTMYWSEKYNAYAWLVISGEGLEKVKTDAAAAVKAIDGEKTAIVYDGDVNLTTNVDINDAQLVWNMYNAQYSAFNETVTMLKFLKADMNGDTTLDTKDAAAIVELFTK